MDKEQIYRKMRETYGHKSQSMVLMEECGELIAAVSQYHRGRVSHDVVMEEIADVLVTCEQLMLNISDDTGLTADGIVRVIEKIKDRKIERMNKRLTDEKL